MAGATEPPEEVLRRIEKFSPEEKLKALLALGEPGSKRLATEFIENLCQLKSVKIHSETTLTTVFTFPVTKYYCSGNGTLHGGAHSLIFDICTSLTIMAIGRKGFWDNGGVTRVLTVNYLRPAPLGVEMELETEIVAVGKTLALLRAVMRNASDGKAISTCEHSKVAIPFKQSLKL